MANKLIECDNCHGDGYTIEVEAECCLDFREYGCCGVPNPVQVQVECHKCQNGIIEIEENDK